jgi:hypothetical protein
MNARSICAAGLLALAPAAAFAFETVDTLPWPSSGTFGAYSMEGAREWGFSLEAGAMYDDNPLRRSSAIETDTIMRVGAGVSSTGLIYGRQRVTLDARLDGYKYFNLDELDHFAYGLRADWLWEFGNDLSGSTGYRRRHRLADPAESGRATKAMITEDRLHAIGGYRLAADWRLTGGAEFSYLDRDDRLAGETGTLTLRTGIDYVSTLGNSIGVEVRRTEGDAPVSPELGIGDFPDNRVEETEVAGRLSYGLGTSLRVGARVGHTDRKYTELPSRNFSGTTWRAAAEWRPGPKTVLLLETFNEPTAIIDADALHVIRKGWAFGPAWAPTLKLVFSARFTQERRQYQGDPTIDAGAPLRDETLRVMRFGVGWEPQRNWRVGAAYDHGERESNTLGRDFEFNAVVLNLRYTY